MTTCAKIQTNWNNICALFQGTIHFNRGTLNYIAMQQNSTHSILTNNNSSDSFIAMPFSAKRATAVLVLAAEEAEVEEVLADKIPCKFRLKAQQARLRFLHFPPTAARDRKEQQLSSSEASRNGDGRKTIPASDLESFISFHSNFSYL